MFSAAVALADDSITSRAIHCCQALKIDDRLLYEVVLQSYLFLGFPRMLIAAQCLDAHADVKHAAGETLTAQPGEMELWFERGEQLCRKVYAHNYELLKSRVESFAPEVFRWMILEGYGKVLSRDGLGIVARETAIMTCLIMENKPQQLHSHMQGALNVGAPKDLIRKVVLEDIGQSAGDGYRTALDVMSRLEISS